MIECTLVKFKLFSSVVVTKTRSSSSSRGLIVDVNEMMDKQKTVSRRMIKTKKKTSKPKLGKRFLVDVSIADC